MLRLQRGEVLWQQGLNVHRVRPRYFLEGRQLLVYGVPQRYLRLREPVHVLRDLPERDLFQIRCLYLRHLSWRQGVGSGLGHVRHLVS